MITLKKNNAEQIRIEKLNYKGHDVVNMRVWWTSPEGREIPTKKGLTITLDMLPDLLTALHGL